MNTEINMGLQFVISVNSIKIKDTGCHVCFSFPDFIHVFGGIYYLGLVIVRLNVLKILSSSRYCTSCTLCRVKTKKKLYKDTLHIALGKETQVLTS